MEDSVSHDQSETVFLNVIMSRHSIALRKNNWVFSLQRAVNVLDAGVKYKCISRYCGTANV